MGSSDRQIFGSNVRRLREILKLTQEDLAEASELDRSYIGGIERGERNPALNSILRLSSALKVVPAVLFQGIGESIPPVYADTSAHECRTGSIGESMPPTYTPDAMQSIATDDGLLIWFKYDQYDAEYPLIGATQDEFDEVLHVLRDGLVSGMRRSDVVAKAFLQAVRTWPDANPSDLWTFIINRAYCDRSNHPESNARLNLEQSWKRTSGWALEKSITVHYGSFLLANGIYAKPRSKSEKAALLGDIGDSRIVPDKADIMLTFDCENEEQLLGVVHVKASIAERRTDDVPMSQALLEAGYLSVFWTMDSKSFPSARPVNLGEFGSASEYQVSDKRRDFEEHGHFSACFSYNQNTMPTEDDSAAARIFVCDFTDPNDLFSQFLIASLHQRSFG